MYFRLRLDQDPEMAVGNLRPYYWGVEIDTDGNLNAYEFLAIVDGVTDTVVLMENDVTGATGDPDDVAETGVNSWGSNNFTVIAAPTSFNGDPDFFLDFAVSTADLMTNGITGIPIRLIFGVSSFAARLNGDLAAVSDSGTLDEAASDPIICTP